MSNREEEKSKKWCLINSKHLTKCLWGCKRDHILLTEDYEDDALWLCNTIPIFINMEYYKDRSEADLTSCRYFLLSFCSSPFWCCLVCQMPSITAIMRVTLRLVQTLTLWELLQNIAESRNTQRPWNIRSSHQRTIMPDTYVQADIKWSSNDHWS